MLFSNTLAAKNKKDIVLHVKFSRNPFHSSGWTTGAFNEHYADGLGQTNKQTDCFVNKVFICCFFFIFKAPSWCILPLVRIKRLVEYGF